jgi:leucyl aminopeptidase
MWKIPSLRSQPKLVAVEADLVLIAQDATRSKSDEEGLYGVLQAQLVRQKVVSGKLGQTAFVRNGGKRLAESVLFVGVGPASSLDTEKYRRAGAQAYSKLSTEKVSSARIRAEDFQGADPIAAAGAFAEGFLLASYRFDHHKSSAPESQAFSLTFVVSPRSGLAQSLSAELGRVKVVAECVGLSRDLSNEPSNVGTPEFMASEIQKLAKKYGLKCRVLNERQAASEKMALFLGVGAGSEREGKVVVLEYSPKKPRKTVALVGKGITFDSGGISIKPAANMEAMKHDMGGAAAVVAATFLAARQKSPNRVVCVAGFTENMPDGAALQPGNIIRARSGKTVEIINTDAEGRLILADLLDLAQDYKPDVCVDAATLTFAISIALGQHFAGLFTPDQKLQERLVQAAQAEGEKLWPMPLPEESLDDIKSDHADLKNSVNDSFAGSIRAAVFLQQFVRKGQAWAHIDMSNVAKNMGYLPYVPKRGGTGLLVRTLARFASEY